MVSVPLRPRRRRIAAVAALAVAALAGCSTATPAPSAEIPRCSEAQINALLSTLGMQLPPLVAGMADTDFTPPLVIEGHTPVCVAHVNIDMAGIAAEGSVAVLTGSDATLDALEAHFTAQGWQPSSGSGVVGVMVDQYVVGATHLTSVVTDPEALQTFDNPDDLIAVTAISGG